MTPQLSRHLGEVLGFNYATPAERDRVISAAVPVDTYDELPIGVRRLVEEIATRGPAAPARLLVGGQWVDLVDLLGLLNHPGHSDQRSHGRKKGTAAEPGGAGSGKVGPKASALDRVDNTDDARAQAMGANPNYGGPYQGPVTDEVRRDGVSYTQNCTRVAIAYEMRRRGVDVTAGVGTPRGDTTAAYVRTFRDGGKYATRVSEDLGRNMSARQVTDEVEAWPLGGRGIVTVSGHTFNVERNPKTGKATFIDAQAADRKSPVMDVKGLARRMKARGAPTDERMAVARVDDLDVSDYGLRYVESSKLNIANGQVGKSTFPSPEKGRIASVEEIAAMKPDDSYP